MDSDTLNDWWTSPVFNPNNTTVYGGGQFQPIHSPHTAPFMKRDDSGSSFTSYASNNTAVTFQSLDSNSSFSSYGNGTSPVTPDMTFGGYPPHQDYLPIYSGSASTNCGTSRAALVEEYDMSGEPLVSIAMKFDPAIDWWLYYEFHVNKDGAYHILKQQYQATKDYPVKRFSDKEYDEKGRLVHRCYVPGCKSNPVRRPFDLERHFTTVHGKGGAESYYCDYPKCKHTEAFDRKDHCREHYREYHREDLLKNRQKDAAQWLEDRNVVSSWWRCSRCLKRNQTERGWGCSGDCNKSCEDARIVARNSKLKAAEAKVKIEQQTLPSFQPLIQGCGQCESGWIPDEPNTHNWVPCLVCRPESAEEMSL